MATLVFDSDAAVMLKWVLAGAEKHGAEHYIIISIADDGYTKLSTNTPFPRSLDIEAENVDQSYDVAIPASCIPDAKAIEEGDHLTISISKPDDGSDEVVYISAGNTTIKVDNLYEQCAVLPQDTPKATTLATVGAHEVVEALSTASKLSPRQASVSIDCDDQQLSIGAISDQIHSQEVFPSSLAEGEEYHIRVGAKSFTPLNAVTKMEYIEDLVIKQSQGRVHLSFPVSAEYTQVEKMEMIIDTVVEKPVNYDSPCDEDIDPAISFSKAELRGALDPVSAISPDGILSIDTTAGNGVKLTIGDAVKTIVLDAEVYRSTVIDVALSDVLVAIKNISTPVVDLGVIEDAEGQMWAAISPSHEDDVDTGADLVIAMPCDVN